MPNLPIFRPRANRIAAYASSNLPSWAETASINPRHPLSGQLAFLFVPGASGFRDLVRGDIATGSGSLTAVDTPFGPSWIMGASPSTVGGFKTIGGDTNYYNKTPTALSIACGAWNQAVITNPASRNVFAYWADTGSGANEIEVGLLLSSTHMLPYCQISGSSSANTATTAAVTPDGNADGVAESIAGSYTSGALRVGYQSQSSGGNQAFISGGPVSTTKSVVNLGQVFIGDAFANAATGRALLWVAGWFTAFVPNDLAWAVSGAGGLPHGLVIQAAPRTYTFSPAVVVNGDLTETATAADTIDTSAVIATGTLTETASAGDTIDTGSIVAGALSETITAVDTIDVTSVLATGTLSETATASDTVDTTSVFATGTLSETAAASDTLDGSSASTGPLSELVTASDTIDAVAEVTAALNETISASDTIDSSLAAAGALLESASASATIDVSVVRVTGTLVETTFAFDTISIPITYELRESALATDRIDAATTKPPPRVFTGSVQLIPLSPVPQVLSIVIGGTEYGLVIQWCAPANCWMMDITDLDDNPIVSGVPLITGADLLAQYPHLKFNVSLVVQTSNDADAVPTGTNLGIEGNLYIVSAGQ